MKINKKLNYGNIEPELLNSVLGEDYFNGEYTLKNELDKYGEDIIISRYLFTNNKFEFFHAWTKSYTMVLINDLIGEKIILGLERNPPDRLYKKNKKHKKKHYARI